MNTENNEFERNKSLPLVSSSGRILAEFPKEAIKSLLHCLVGNPDSIIKIYNKKIRVSLVDLTRLNTSICEKLRQHQTEGICTSISIAYENNSIEDFSTWSNFEEHNWSIPETTKEISIKWDFLITFPHNEIPQRHTLSVRIANDINPLQMMQILFSTDAEDNEDKLMQIATAPMSCKVDFINHLLGRELINIIDDWNKILPTTFEPNNIFLKLRKHREAVADIIHYSLPSIMICLSISAVYYYLNNRMSGDALTIDDLSFYMYWLSFSTIAIYLMHAISLKLAISSYKAFEKLGNSSIIKITAGDEKKETDILLKYQSNRDKLIRNFITTFLMDIVSGITIWFLTNR